MRFQFKTKEKYLEAWEYLMRINEGFKCHPDRHYIEIAPIDHDQLPIYDEEVVDRLNSICDEKTNDDDLLAREIKKNVAG